MYDILEKVKKTLIAIAPVVTAVCAIWGLDVAGAVSATEVFIIACLEYAGWWVEKKAEKDA